MLYLNYNKIEKKYPRAVKAIKLYPQSPRILYNKFDELGVRVLLGYGGNGGFKVTIYRRKTKNELAKEMVRGVDENWRMTRIGIIQSYQHRIEAEKVGFEEAFKQLEILLEDGK